MKTAYATPRKLGQLAAVSSPEAFLHEREIGSDALGLSEKQFLHLASGRRGKIKSLLMNQRHIAGIGNIYSDEILFQARIHPESAVNDLDEDRLKRLYKELRSVLRSAIDANAGVENTRLLFTVPQS